jgi:hypothetical protein
MNTNKNFLRFMGFRKQSFVVIANQVHDSGNAATAQKLVLADDIGAFGNIVNPLEVGTDLIVTVTADGGEAGHRGLQYTLDAMTGKAFDAAGNVATGDVTRIHSDDLALHASNGTLTIAGVSTNVGYNLSLGETVDVYSYLGAGDTDTKVIPFHSVLNATNAHAASTAQSENDMIVFPAANYLGADAVGSRATRLSFKSTAGTAADDNVLLGHPVGKFKAICEMMQAAINAKHSHGPIVVTDVANGIVPFSNQFDLGITSCQITCA